MKFLNPFDNRELTIARSKDGVLIRDSENEVLRTSDHAGFVQKLVQVGAGAKFSYLERLSASLGTSDWDDFSVGYSNGVLNVGGKFQMHLGDVLPFIRHVYELLGDHAGISKINNL